MLREREMLARNLAPEVRLGRVCPRLARHAACGHVARTFPPPKSLRNSSVDHYVGFNW